MTKIIVLGNNLSGKTRFCTKALNCSITESAGYTEAYGFYPINNDLGKEVHLWDMGRGGMRDGYFIGSNAGIIIYENSSTKRKYEKELRQNCGDVPIVYIKSSSIDELTTTDAINIIDDLIQKL